MTVIRPRARSDAGTADDYAANDVACEINFDGDLGARYD